MNNVIFCNQQFLTITLGTAVRPTQALATDYMGTVG
jgi:hypothetical protein